MDDELKKGTEARYTSAQQGKTNRKQKGGEKRSTQRNEQEQLLAAKHHGRITPVMDRERKLKAIDNDVKIRTMRRPVLTYFDVCKAPSGAWVGRCPSPQLPRSLSDIFISFIAASIKHWLVTIWSGVLTFTYRSAGCLQLVNYNQIRSTQLMLQNSWPSRHRLQSRPLLMQSDYVLLPSE